MTYKLYILLPCQMRDINSMSNENALATNRCNSVPCTVMNFRLRSCNQLVVFCNNWNVEPLDLPNGPALGCYKPSSEVLIVLYRMQKGLKHQYNSFRISVDFWYPRKFYCVCYLNVSSNIINGFKTFSTFRLDFRKCVCLIFTWYTLITWYFHISYFLHYQLNSLFCSWSINTLPPLFGFFYQGGEVYFSISRGALTMQDRILTHFHITNITLT